MEDEHPRLVDNAEIVAPVRTSHLSRRSCSYREARRPEKSSTLSIELAMRYLRIIFKRKREILLIFAVAVVASGIYALLVPPTFRSFATLDIEGENKKALNLDTTLQIADRDYFTTQIAILKNRALVQKLTERMNLAAHKEFQDEGGFVSTLVHNIWSSLRSIIGIKAKFDPELESLRQEDRLINAVMTKISVESHGKGRLVSVSMDSEDPRLATEILHNFINIFLEYNLGRRRSESLESTTWLKKELQAVGREVERSRGDLIAFTNKHGIVTMQKEGNHVLTQFNVAADGLLKSKESRFKLESFQHQRSIGETQAVPGSVNVEHLVKLKENLSLLESEYAQMTTVYSPSYPKALAMRRRIEELRRKIAEIESATISVAVGAAKHEEVLLRQDFEKAKKAAMDQNSLGIQYATLQKEVDTNERVYQMFLQKAKEMEVMAGVTGNNISLILPPVMPMDPIKPKKLLYVMVGGALGLFVGILGAFVREYRDESIKSMQDLKNFLSIPTLGAVPDLKRLRQWNPVPACTPELRAYQQPRSPLHDTLRNIYASIAFSLLPQGSVRTLVFTSAEPEEGKTFLAVSMATVICDHDVKVLIVDCDLRRPKIHHVFKMDSKIPGLTSFLSGTTAKLNDVVRPTRVPGLDVITSGPMHENPVAILQSPRMKDLLEDCNRKYDIVILDCPPVIGFADSRILAASTDGVIFVVRESYVSRRILNEALDSLPQANVVGAILNMSDPKYGPYGNGWYNKYYTPVQYWRSD